MRNQASAAVSQLAILAGYGAQLVVAFALTVLLGRSLTPAEFGFFALVAAIFSFARDATDLGTAAAASRDMRRDPARERSLLEGLVAWRAALGGLLALGVLGLAFAQADPTRRGVLVGTAAALVILAPTAFQAVFLARQAQVVPALIAFASQILLLAGAATAVVAGWSGLAAAGLVAAREALAAVAVGLYGCWLVGYRPRPGVRGRGLRAFAGAASLWALAALCRHLYGQADLLAVYALRGEAEVGALAAAWRPLSPAFAIPWVATAPLVPVLAAAFADEPARFRELLRQSLRIAVGVGAVVGACGIALAPDLVVLFYAGRYGEAPLDAATAMRWLSLAVVPVHAMAVAAVALLAAGRERLVLRTIGAGLVLKVVANVALVPAGGFHAAVVVTVALESAVAVVLVVAACAGERPGLPSRATLAALLPAVAVGAAGALLEAAPAARVAALLAVGGAGIAALLASPVGRDYFGALRAAGGHGRGAAQLDVEGDVPFAFGDANGYNSASGAAAPLGDGSRPRGKR